MQQPMSAIAEWWQSWPAANIGISTGAVSGLLVLDLDPRNGGPADRLELAEMFGPIPETAEAITGGGGRHLFFGMLAARCRRRWLRVLT
jgi:hypothetical protein